ncbi:hypothetical protein F5148DRAFT_1216255, partial [Russula earlei]
IGASPPSPPAWMLACGVASMVQYLFGTWPPRAMTMFSPPGRPWIASCTRWSAGNSLPTGSACLGHPSHHCADVSGVSVKGKRLFHKQVIGTFFFSQKGI